MYLKLLKDALSGELQVTNDYTTGWPLDWTPPRRRLKHRLKRWILRRMNRRGYYVVKRDPRPALERMALPPGTNVWGMAADTMVGPKRLDNIQACVETILADGVPGDLIETGVWRGGATIFMRALLKVHDVDDRDVWVCDSFAGLPPPDPNVPADQGDIHSELDFLAIPLEIVKANFEKYGMLDDRVHFVKGFFEQTLKDVPVERLALMRLDGDMYSSTMAALEPLYPKLSPGGFCIIDDYGLPPCAKAVEDYRKAHGIDAELVDVDGMARYWRKE